jgi:hypothetical protein
MRMLVYSYVGLFFSFSKNDGTTFSTISVHGTPVVGDEEIVTIDKKPGKRIRRLMNDATGR